MTARVTSSASDSLGAIPTAGRQGARCGAVFSRSSVVTYSAVARVSRSASTGPPRLDVGFATPILDALLRLRIWPLGGRKLRPLGIGHLVLPRLQMEACQRGRWPPRGVNTSEVATTPSRDRAPGSARSPAAAPYQGRPGGSAPRSGRRPPGLVASLTSGGTGPPRRSGRRG